MACICSNHSGCFIAHSNPPSFASFLPAADSGRSEYSSRRFRLQNLITSIKDHETLTFTLVEPVFHLLPSAVSFGLRIEPSHSIGPYLAPIRTQKFPRFHPKLIIYHIDRWGELPMQNLNTTTIKYCFLTHPRDSRDRLQTIQYIFVCEHPKQKKTFIFLANSAGAVSSRFSCKNTLYVGLFALNRLC
jgi:hypothetical protein